MGCCAGVILQYESQLYSNCLRRSICLYLLRVNLIVEVFVILLSETENLHYVVAVSTL